MNEYIELRLINVADSGIGLKDTAGRVYSVPMNGQLRVSLENFKAILDNPVSKKIICKGNIKVEGLSAEMLRGSILTDEEEDYLLGTRIAPAIEDSGIKHIEVEQEEEIVPIIKAITFYNWIKNDKEEKLREVLKNPVNYDTLKDIIAKNERYNTDVVKKVLAEYK